VLHRIDGGVLLSILSSMNRLPFEKRRQILHMMVEGGSIRGIARVADVSPVTVLRYLALAGAACQDFHDEKVCGLQSRRIQCDEIWSFNYCKGGNLKKAKAAPEDAGDVWTWTAIDADTKLIVSYLVGNRGGESATAFMHDVAGRCANRVQLTTDGHNAYLDAVADAFAGHVDYAMLAKQYGKPSGSGPERRYSPPECVGAKKKRVTGNPNMAHVNTSYVESHNQKMRQHMRRFTRLTAAHSKKFDNHCHMVALYTTWYNWVRINSAVKVAPAMAAGLSDRLWEMDDLVRLVEAYEGRVA
jgi:IS1 family transposase